MLPTHLENKEVIILTDITEAYMEYYDQVEEEFLEANEDLRLEQIGYTQKQIDDLSEEELRYEEWELRNERFLNNCIKSEKIIRSQFGLLLIMNKI